MQTDQWGNTRERCGSGSMIDSGLSTRLVCLGPLLFYRTPGVSLESDHSQPYVEIKAVA